MQFIADFWWFWAIAFVLLVAFVVRRTMHSQNHPSRHHGEMEGIFLKFALPALVFGALLFLSIVLNVIQFAKGV